MLRLIAIAAIAAAVVMPSAAWAWGNEGHEVIALIAASELSPAAKAKVEQLLGGDAASAMADVSTWSPVKNAQGIDAESKIVGLK